MVVVRKRHCHEHGYVRMATIGKPIGSQPTRAHAYVDEGGDDGDANTNCEHVLTIRGRDGGEVRGRM